MQAKERIVVGGALTAVIFALFLQPVISLVQTDTIVFTYGSIATITPPTAVFSAVPPAQTAGQPIVFDASLSTGGWDGAQSTTITAYTWDFGDGATGSGVMASHTYASAGSYIVRLTVTASDGQTGFIEQTLTVIPAGGAELLYATGFENAQTNPKGWHLDLGDLIPSTGTPQYNYIVHESPPVIYIEGLETRPSYSSFPSDFAQLPGSTRCLGMYLTANQGSNIRRSNFALFTVPSSWTTSSGAYSTSQPDLTHNEFYVEQMMYLNDMELSSPTDQWRSIYQISNVAGDVNPYFAFHILGHTGHSNLADSGTITAALAWRQANGNLGYIATYRNFQNVLPIKSWFKFAYYMVRHPTNGILKFWVNNVLVFDVSGIDTTTTSVGYGNEYGTYSLDTQGYMSSNDPNPHWQFVDDIKVWSSVPPTL